MLKSYLDQDAFVFSGLKTHKQLTNARALLKDENGNIRPWHQFEQEITKLNRAYNTNYLEAEYQFAIHSAQSADRWSDLSENTDKYLLQYRTAQDERVRENHQALAGTTLPKDDPFWDSYYPPNGWRCRCVAVEVLSGKYPTSNSTESIAKGETATTSISKSGSNKLSMFRFNPGKEKKLFPPKNSYVPKGCGGTLNITDSVFLALDDEACRAKKIIESHAASKNIGNFRTLKSFNNGGKIEIHTLANQKESDFNDVYNCCDFWAKQGDHTQIFPKIKPTDQNYESVYSELKGTIYWGKSPDFKVNGVFWELEGYVTKKPDEGTISHMLKRGAKQSSRIVITHIPDTSNHFYKKKVYDKINQKNSKSVINEVWVMNGKQLTLIYKKQ